MDYPKVKAVGIVVLLIVLWETIYTAGLIQRGVFPSPVGIAYALWENRANFAHHTLSTASVAFKGYVCGSLLAICFALLFFFIPRSRFILQTFFLSLFSVPLVVLVPLVALLYGDSTGVIVVTLTVLYPTLVATHLGLDRPDPRLVTVVKASGGGDLKQFLKVRIPSAIPTILVGLRVACPVAILGTMLVEFVQGDSGLGRYLLGAMTTANIDEIWAIAFGATLLALLPYGFLSAIGSRITRRAHVERPTLQYIEGYDRAHIYRALTGAVVALALWQVFVDLSGKGAIIAKGPIEIVQVVSGALFPEIVSTIIHCGFETLPLVLIGIVASLVISFCFALLNFMLPATRPLWSFSLLVQAVPLVVFVPLVVTVFGRGQLALVMIVVSATILPSYETMYQGLSSIPRHYFDVAMVHGSSHATLIQKVCIPSTIPFFFEALRLIAPRALLGALLGEYILTYSGLGGLLAQARGAGDFQMLWMIAVVTTAFSLVVHLVLTVAVSRASRSRRIKDRIW